MWSLPSILSLALRAGQRASVVPRLAAHLIERVGRPLHDMERVGDPDRFRASGRDDGVDEVSPICRDMGDLGTPLLTEEVEELTHRGAVASRRSPHQAPMVVVNHDHQVLVALLVADLVDPDPA